MNSRVLARMAAAGLVPQQPVQYEGRLMTPPPKIVQRIIHDAVVSTAGKMQISFDAVEGSFQRSSHEMAHLLAHDRYPDALKQSWEALKGAHERFMTTKGSPGSHRFNYTALEQTFKKISTGMEHLEWFQKLTADDLKQFIAVADQARADAKAQSWDPEQIVKVDHYRLATMMASNFEAYQKTLE